MQPNPRAPRAPRDPERSGLPASFTSSPSRSSNEDIEASAAAVTALWCPHCKSPFIGMVDARDLSFTHPQCGGRGVLDMALLDALAADSWFWRRYRDRLRVQD